MKKLFSVMLMSTAILYVGIAIYFIKHIQVPIIKSITTGWFCLTKSLSHMLTSSVSHRKMRCSCRERRLWKFLLFCHAAWAPPSPNLSSTIVWNHHLQEWTTTVWPSYLLDILFDIPFHMPQSSMQHTHFQPGFDGFYMSPTDHDYGDQLHNPVLDNLTHPLPPDHYDCICHYLSCTPSAYRGTTEGALEGDPVMCSTTCIDTPNHEAPTPCDFDVNDAPVGIDNHCMACMSHLHEWIYFKA